MIFTKLEQQMMAHYEAKRRNLKQCSDKTVMAVLSSSNGNVYFGFNFVGVEAAECPRKGMARGKGYHLCKSRCEAQEHAEIDALRQFDEHEPKGTHGTLRVYGVNHICDGCREVLSKRPEIGFGLGVLR